MYEQFYGFSERPFQLTPDPAYFFESITHKKALSYLGYGLNQGEGFVVITGEVGAGKSTLVAHLKQKLDPSRMAVAEVVTSALDGEEMIHVAARSFGIDVEGKDKGGALAAIENFLHEQARDGKRSLLIVDESQNLSIGALEELRMLSNFQLGAHPLLQTLLLGQPEFKRLLAGSDELEQLRQRVIAAHHLDAMQPGEVEPYIRHRLAHVGWDGNPEFERGIFLKLHRATGGIPRKINQVMTRLLLLGAVEEQSVLEVDMLDSVLEEMNGDAEVHFDADTVRPDPSIPAAQAVADARRREEERRAPVSSPAPAAPSAELPKSDGGLAEAQIAAIEKAFAVRDRELTALRSELAELRDQGGGAASHGAEGRLGHIEARLDEQEATLRQVLGMLIDFLETNGRREAA